MSNEQMENKEKLIEEGKKKGRNLFLKIVCVLLALLLWVYVSYDKNPVSTKTFNDIPVILHGIEILEGRNLTVLKSDIGVSVKLSGTRNLLARVNSDAIKAVVNVSDITSVGIQNPIIEISGISNALGVVDKKITKGKLTVDRLVKKSLDINIEYTGKIDESIVHQGNEDTVVPTQVTVRGPETLLGDIAAYTETVDISNVKNSETIFETGIVLKNSKGEIVSSNMITLSDTVAKVSVYCHGKKEVPVIPPSIVGSLSGYNVQVSLVEPETVTITGLPEVLEGIDSIELSPIEAFYTEGKKVFRKELNLPDDVKCETTNVNVTVKVEKLQENEENTELTE